MDLESYYNSTASIPDLVTKYGYTYNILDATLLRDVSYTYWVNCRYNILGQINLYLNSNPENTLELLLTGANNYIDYVTIMNEGSEFSYTYRIKSVDSFLHFLGELKYFMDITEINEFVNKEFYRRLSDCAIPSQEVDDFLNTFLKELILIDYDTITLVDGTVLENVNIFSTNTNKVTHGILHISSEKVDDLPRFSIKSELFSCVISISDLFRFIRCNSVYSQTEVVNMYKTCIAKVIEEIERNTKLPTGFIIPIENYSKEIIKFLSSN